MRLLSYKFILVYWVQFDIHVTTSMSFKHNSISFIAVTNDMQVLLDVLGMQSDLTSYLGPPLMHSILSGDFGGSGVFDYGVIQALVDQTPTFILQVSIDPLKY